MKKKLPFILLLLILILAAFLRLYRISDYMTFLGDEGRDVLVVKKILEGDPTFLGPRASAGDFYLGPIYYYMMIPFLWLFRLDPVGPAVMVALLGIATVFLTYMAGKKFFNNNAGLFAAALYTVSPLIITYSRSSWNPNVLPFFSLLSILTIFKAISRVSSVKYFFITGIILGIALQLHYLALFLIAIIVTFVFFAEWIQNKKILLLPLLKHYVFLLVGFITGFSPFLAFEIKNHFPNTRTIYNFVIGDTLQKDYETHATFWTTITDVFLRLFNRLVFDKPLFDPAVWNIFALIIIAASIIGLFYKTNTYVRLLLCLWLFLGVFLFGFYKKGIYDYYFAFLFPLPFLLIGNVFSQLSQFKIAKKRHIFGIVLSFMLFLILFISNLLYMPFRYTPNRQKDQLKQIAEFVISQTGNKPFNFALVTGGNSDHAYRYYLEILGHKPVTIQNTEIDPKRETVTSQLFVVCEDTGCQPLGNSLWEIAGFGRAEIVKEWNVSVVKVYKLIHYKEKL